MRRFLLKLGLFLAIQIAGVAWYESTVWSGNNRGYMDALQDKAALLARADEPGRVILVGGSNTAWGLNAVDLGHALGRPVVNTGLHAALGLDVMLDFPAAYLRPGDIVILSLEYEHYQYDTRHDETIWTSAPSFRGLPAQPVTLRPVYIADHFLQYVAAARDHAVNQSKARDRQDEGEFTRAAFDARGDMTGHYNQPPLAPAEDFAFDFRAPAPVFLDQIIARLNGFAAAAKARGAQVYLYFPPLPRQKFALYHAQLAALDATLRARLNFPVLNDPGDLLLAHDDCYNTVYHLTRPGIDKRDAALAEKLQGVLPPRPAL